MGLCSLRQLIVSGETKDKYFIVNLMKEVINEVEASNVV